MAERERVLWANNQAKSGRGGSFFGPVRGDYNSAVITANPVHRVRACTRTHTGSACKVHITTDTLVSLGFCALYNEPSASQTNKEYIHVIIIIKGERDEGQ